MPRNAVSEIPQRSKIDVEESKLIQLKNEQSKYEKEIDLLKMRYDNEQRRYQELSKSYNSQWQVDRDKINRQLIDNKALQDKLNKTQMEVNQLRASIEKDLQKQKDILLRKEVELMDKLKEVDVLKEDLSKRLAKEDKSSGH